MPFFSGTVSGGERLKTASPVVQLRANPLQAQLGNPVGATVPGRYETFVLEFPEQPLGTARPIPAVSRDCFLIDDTASLVLFHEDIAALSQQVKNPLFGF